MMIQLDQFLIKNGLTGYIIHEAFGFFFQATVLILISGYRLHITLLAVCALLIFHCVHEKSGVPWKKKKLMFLPFPKEGSRVSCCEAVGATASSQLMLFHWD